MSKGLEADPQNPSTASETLVMAPGGSRVTKAFCPKKAMGPWHLSLLLRMSPLSTAQPRTSQETGRAAGASWSADRWRSGSWRERGQRLGQPTAVGPAPGSPLMSPRPVLSPARVTSHQGPASAGWGQGREECPHLWPCPTCRGLEPRAVRQAEPPHRGLPGKGRQLLRGPKLASGFFQPPGS